MELQAGRRECGETTVTVQPQPAYLTQNMLPSQCARLTHPTNMNSLRAVARLLPRSSRQLGSRSLAHPAIEPRQDPFQLTKPELQSLVQDIHSELDMEMRGDCELREISKYYFDGQGKAIRPVIALCLGHAFNFHTGAGQETAQNQGRGQITRSRRAKS